MNKNELLDAYVASFNDEVDDSLDCYGDVDEMDFRYEHKTFLQKSNDYLRQVCAKVYKPNDFILSDLDGNFQNTVMFGAKVYAYISLSTNKLKSATKDQKYALSCLKYLYPKFDKNFGAKVKKAKTLLEKQFDFDGGKQG